MKTLHVKVAEKVYQQLDSLVDQGWFQSHQEILVEALRKFLSSHRPELLEQFIREDVEWGLRGGK